MKSEPESKLQKLLIDIQQADKDYIAKLKISEPLDADIKSFLAAIMNEFAAIPNGNKAPSEAKIEREALGHPRYREHLKNVVLAKLDTIEAKRKYEDLVRWFDALRSELAMERETIKKGLFSEGNPR